MAALPVPFAREHGGEMKTDHLDALIDDELCGDGAVKAAGYQ
jgi:hypothetical protein